MSTMPSQPSRRSPPAGRLITAPAIDPTEIGSRDAGADASWQLAIRLLAAWRSAGGDRHAVAARLAKEAEHPGVAVAEPAVAGLDTVAGMFVELYTERLDVPSDGVLPDTATGIGGNGLCSWRSRKPPAS